LDLAASARAFAAEDWSWFTHGEEQWIHLESKVVNVYPILPNSAASWLVIPAATEVEHPLWVPRIWKVKVN